MYYILNQTNQIIAADKDFLTYCGVSHIDDLFLQIAKEETYLTTIQDSITIKTASKENSFPSKSTILSSLLGDLTLVTLTEVDNTIQADNTSFLLEDTVETVEDSNTDTKEVFSIDHDTLLETKTTIEAAETADIIIDIKSISKTIGISNKDYKTFFNEFIDTAISLEKDFQDEDTDKQKLATDILSQLSDVLHLPMMGSIVQDIKAENGDKKQALVFSFYNTLSRLTLSNAKEEATEELDILNDTPTKIELFDEPLDILADTSSEVKSETAKTPQAGESFGTISLDNIKPKSFAFALKEAADDLSLPVELIKEFVDDFIEQAHSETTNMLKAYEAGDLDKVQKIGHLLKGASSNLRINPLSETLYKIQFCKDPNDLEALIHDYWAHFIAFEQQINQTSN